MASNCSRIQNRRGFQASYPTAYHYIVGALAALFVVGLANASLPMPGAAVERLIRLLARSTLGLYLLHYPLLNFFGTVIPSQPERAMHRMLVFGLTLGVAIALAYVIEGAEKGTETRFALGAQYGARETSPPGPAVPRTFLIRTSSRRMLRRRLLLDLIQGSNLR